MRRILEEILRLFDCYLSKYWVLVLTRFCLAIVVITEEGFKGIQILAFDDNIERSTRLSKWIKQHDGVVFQISVQIFVCYESKSDMAQGKIGVEMHTDTKMVDDDNDDDDNNDDGDEDDHDHSDAESEMDNNDDEDNTIFCWD